MTQQLGEKYQGTKSVCGLVGYLAAANCLVAGSADHKRKEKFMKDSIPTAFIGLLRIY